MLFTPDPQTIPGFLPGSSSLLEQLDKRLLLILRDGRHIIGVLRSFDQFCNFALEDAIERRFKVSEDEKITYYSDIKLGGVFLVRGDSVVILGEVSNIGDQENSGLKEVSLEEFSRIKQETENASGHQPSLAWDME